MKSRRWDALLSRLPKGTNLVGAEVGVWKGAMSVRLLEAHPELFLFMIDRWESPEPGDSYYNSDQTSCSSMEAWAEAREKAEKIAARFPYRAKIHWTSSAAAARILSGCQLDFVFIDGDHTYEGVKRDIELWQHLVIPGGLLSGHDYQNPSHPGVKKAVDEWAAASKAQLELDADHTWFARRERS